MKQIRMSLLMLVMCSVPVAWAQQSGNRLNVYDNFGSRWLDPQKWQPTNPQCWGNVLECVRQIQHGRLYLAVRNFGNTDSDTGINWSESEVYFRNQNAVSSITADVTVRSYSGIGCSTNDTDRTHTQVDMGGAFFNTGSGDPFDDVTGLLIIWIDTFDPLTMNVGGWWGWKDQGFWNFIASYPIGTPLTGTIKWDKANHQFIASVKAKGEVGSSVVMPYSLPDSASPANANKRLDAGAHTLNCTSANTMGQVEATYDNVTINR